MITLFIVAQSCTGLLGPSELQAIVDDEKAAKLKFEREHPFICEFMMKRNVPCTFRAKNIGGLKVHAGAVHMWKAGQELKYVDVSWISSSENSERSPSISPVAATPVVRSPGAPVYASPVRAAAGGGAAAATKSPVVAAPPKKKRVCGKCKQQGHRADSAKCPLQSSNMMKGLELEGDDD